MHVINIANSRAIRLLRISEGQDRVFWPDFTAILQKEFRFVGVPLSLEDYSNAASGISYRHGKFDGVVIDTLDVFADGIVVNSKGRGEICDKFIDTLLEIGRKQFSFEYDFAPEPRAYVSSLEVELSKDLSRVLTKILGLSKVIEDLLTSYNGVAPPAFLASGFSLSADPSLGPRPAFTFERKADAPLEQNRYTSQAPLVTGDHVKLLDRLGRLL